MQQGEKEHKNNVPATVSFFQLKGEMLAIKITMKEIKSDADVGMINKRGDVSRSGVAPARQRHPSHCRKNVINSHSKWRP
jgi:hypothetical protein